MLNYFLFLFQTEGERMINYWPNLKILKQSLYVSAPIDIILDKWFQFLCMYYVYWKKVWIFIASDKLKCPCSEIACVCFIIKVIKDVNFS